LTYGTVQSVSAGSTGVNLNLTNGSTIGLSDAVQVF